MQESLIGQDFHWYEYLENFFDVEPFSIITEMNKIYRKLKLGKRLSRLNRRKLKNCKEKLKEYLHEWGSDKMQNFRHYISSLLESVFIKFAEREKYELLAKEHNAYYKQKSFFIVYDMLKKYLRSINNNEIYSGLFDSNIMKIISGVSEYIPIVNVSSDDTQSEPSMTQMSYFEMSRASIKPTYSVSGSIGNENRRSNCGKLDETDELTQETVKVLTAAIQIHKSYVKMVCEKKTSYVKTNKTKLEKIKQVMKKKVFALAKGSKRKTPKESYLETSDNIAYSFMKTMQEVKAKRKVLKKVAKNACTNNLYSYSDERKTKKLEKKGETRLSNDGKLQQENDSKTQSRKEKWEASRSKNLTVRKLEMTEGERVLANIKKLECVKKKEFLMRCREGFEELFILPEKEIKSEDVQLEDWLVHNPSTREYYESESATTKVVDKQDENLLESCKTLSDISGDLTPTNELSDFSETEEENSVSDSESVYTNEHYLDDISECFREIDDGAFVPSSCEQVKSSGESEPNHFKDVNTDACIDYKRDGLADQKTFFHKIKKNIPKKLRSYRKEEELSITSELMQELCETSGSETSDSIYDFHPPKEKIPEEKPEISDQPINFRDFNYRKLQLYIMEKRCKASDVSSVSQCNTWNKAIFRKKQREKYQYTKLGVSESYERLKCNIKKLINSLTKARHKKPVLQNVLTKENFSIEVNEKMFEKLNIEDHHETKSGQVTSLCHSESCLKTTDSSTSSDEESEDTVEKIEKEMEKLNLRESHKKDIRTFKEYGKAVCRGFPSRHQLLDGKYQKPLKAKKQRRPVSAPYDDIQSKKTLFGITQFSTVGEIVSCMFSNDATKSSSQVNIQTGDRKKFAPTSGTIQKSLSLKDDEIPHTASAEEINTLSDKSNPELRKDGMESVNSASKLNSSKYKEAECKQNISPEINHLDDLVDIESLLSRDEKSMEKDFYSVVKKRQASESKPAITDVELEYRIKTCTMRYITLKSEKKWPKHCHPDFLHFYRSLLQRRIPLSLLNLKLRTTIPHLNPDNELFELPHYALLPHLHPPITYETNEKIENRILWDRPEKLKLSYSELGDKSYITKPPQIWHSNKTLGDGSSTVDIAEEVTEVSGIDLDFLQSKELNWLTWNPTNYDLNISNKRLRRILLDLGSTPDIYEKFDILLKNRKLGYAPMKELLYSNQEMLFNYVCSQFINKLAVKYPKRFLRLLFFSYNQHGVQRHICTFIKPTRLKPPNLADWQGCARFISNRFHVTPLNDEIYPPLQLNGPDKTLYNQKGNLYELGILLECILLGAGYDAYVVSGMVTQVKASGIMEENDPEEKDTKPPVIGFKREESEQPITIETFFKGKRDKFRDRLENLNFKDEKLLEEIYIQKIAQNEGWEDDVRDKYRQHVRKMGTPQGIDLIEKLKQEIKECQMRRKSTKELEKLLRKLQEERIKYLQEKRTDNIPADEMETLEEECKKYLYLPDIEIKSVYVEKMRLKELKERSERKLLRIIAGEKKKTKEIEEKYFKNLYSDYQTTIYLPPVTKTQKEMEEERYKFFDDIKAQIAGQAEELDQIFQEERASFQNAEEHFIKNDMYELYFGKKIKKERARKLKKSEKAKFKKVAIEGDTEKKVSDAQNLKETENVPRVIENVAEKAEDEISMSSEEISEEDIEEFEAISERELPKKKKINKKAVRTLRAKMEKSYMNLRGPLQGMPIKEPEPVKHIKAINPVIYCWILIKKNDNDVPQNTFLDIKTGLLHPTTDKEYLRIDCVWNDKNYYIPIYQRKHIKETRLFDFSNDKLWWHLLCGEPRKYQKLKRSMRDTVDPMIQKHLEIPRTWVGHMKFPKKRFDRLFKDEKMKTYRYKRIKIEVYEYGAQSIGIRKRVTEFYDMQQTRIQSIRETFEHRNDFLVYKTRFYKNDRNTDTRIDAVKTAEVFEPGRTDQLKCFRCYKFPDGKQLVDMFFYADYRPDFLKMFSISEKRLKMQFIHGRSDQMIKLKMGYFENAFFEREPHKKSRFDRIVVTFHQNPQYSRQLKLIGFFEDPPIRVDIDLKIGLSYYFFKDEKENEVKFTMWGLHYNTVEETFINPQVQPNRVYFSGTNEDRKTKLEREIMLEREQTDKIKYLNLAFSTELEIHDIMKQRRDDEKHVFIDASRKSKWSPGVIEKLKIEQLYLIAHKVEKRLNNLRKQNLFKYLEDLVEGRKLDFVLMQIFKSMAGDEFNLKLAQFTNHLFRKYQKAQNKGSPSAKIFATVADKTCKLIDAYTYYFNKHSKETEEYYRRYNEVEKDESDNILRRHIYGEEFTDKISNLKNVYTLFSPKSMELWFDKWFKKEIRKYGTQDVHEMIQSIDEILLLREPQNIKPINTSFWKALGEFKNTVEQKQEDTLISDKSTTSFVTDSITKINDVEKKEMSSSDTDTDDLCETILARYIDKKNETFSEIVKTSSIDMEDKLLSKQKEFSALDRTCKKKDEINLENVFINEIKKLVKRYGIMSIKEGLTSLGMENYLYHFQKDVGNIDCKFFIEEEQRKELEHFKTEIIKERKTGKHDLDTKFKPKLQYTPSSSTVSFPEKVEKALSAYPWSLKPEELHEDLKTMAENLESELVNCSLKQYPVTKPILTKAEKPESSTKPTLPDPVKTKKIIPFVKKSIQGKMGVNQQNLLKNILYKLILKEQTDASPDQLQKIFNKFLEGKDAWGPEWNNYCDRIKQLLTESYKPKVIEHTFAEYKFQDSRLPKTDKRIYETFLNQFDSEIPFGECDLSSSEKYSEELNCIIADILNDLDKIKCNKAYLPSLENSMDQRIKEYKKK